MVPPKGMKKRGQKVGEEEGYRSTRRKLGRAGGTWGGEPADGSRSLRKFPSKKRARSWKNSWEKLENKININCAGAKTGCAPGPKHGAAKRKKRDRGKKRGKLKKRGKSHGNKD